jgi:LmbE family N-acetylglucosaminyl deacetylase
LWKRVFKTIGQVRGPSGFWTPLGGQRVLVVAPHPDDEVLGCAGTIAKHLSQGDQVEILIVTDGRLSRARNLKPQHMAETREDEAKAASALLSGAKLHWLGLEEGDWKQERFERSLAQIMESYRPDYIYGPCWLDYHPEHCKVAQGLAQCLSSETCVRIYTLHVPLNDLVNLRIDVEQQMPLIRKTFEVYATQTRSLMRGLRMRHYAGLLTGTSLATEEFIELSGRSYRALHAETNVQAKVRGLRHRSFLDPLSYLRGRQSRQRTKNLIT